MRSTTILISLVILLGLSWEIKAQEQPLKDFAEDRKDRKFCFYPSTLRMVNLANNPDFDDLVNGIEKLLIYNLDSTARADKSYKEIITTYQELDFEEYASAYGGGLNFYVYGKENKKETEYIGVVKQDDLLTTFYMRGQIAMNKIPRLIQSMSEGDFINPFDFNLDDFGKNTQDQ
ncbi:MAG: DUF4252 domain-containing protein [Bacteroidales bacterium]|jgi:hypothetical protein|nr:DUF4252 domain-containing protein [Bacteroidales bacterium]